MPEAARIEISPMRIEDLPQVLAIERNSFDDPWRPEHFLHEMLLNRDACCVCVRGTGDRVEAYACIWFVGRKLQINNIAVRPAARGRGLGMRLLDRLLEMGTGRGCRSARLDVRPSNRPAVELYHRAGFRIAGIRRGYYGGGEDAWVMIRDLPGGAKKAARAVVEGESGR
jgi:ribosomal-protein-alanine N-acetyltransferase